MKKQYDLVLINPGRFSESRTYGQMLHEPTMGLYVLKEYLSDKGFKIAVLDGAYQSLQNEQIIKISCCATIVGLYGVYTNMETISELSSEIKQCNPKSIIILGGPNSPAGREILEQYPSIDIVVKNQGERVLEDVLRSVKHDKIADLKTIKGSFLRWKEKIIDTGDSPSSPQFSRPLFIEYEVPVYKKKVMKLITAKGCPNNCDFCPAPTFEEIVAIENLVAAIEEGQNKGINTFYIADENFCPIKLDARVIKMCDLLKSSTQEEKIHLKLFLEPHTSSKVFELLSQIAHVTAFIGFESFSDQTIRFLGKRTSRKLNLDSWNTARKFGINVFPGIISLYPFLVPQELFDLIDILSRYDALSWRLLLKKLDIYPGTNLLIKMKLKYPQLLEEDFSPFTLPSRWRYANDLQMGRPILENIEKSFKFIADRNEMTQIFSLLSDMSMIIGSCTDNRKKEYFSIRSDFGRHTKNIAKSTIQSVIDNPKSNIKRITEPALSRYLLETDKILKRCKKILPVVLAEEKKWIIMNK
jgi:radical SAM superfamily enzyme YgiQ (UPF0313 family)